MPVRISAWHVFQEVLIQLRHFELWVPLILYLTLKMIILALYIGATGGPLASFWMLFLESGLHESFLHYPAHLMLMPTVLSRFDIVLDVFAHSFFQGVTIVLFYSAVTERPLLYTTTFKATFCRYFPLLGVTIVASSVIYICFAVPGYLLPKDSSSLIRLGGLCLGTFVGLSMQTLFLFTGPLVLLKNRSVFAAIRESFEIAVNKFSQKIILVIVPFLITAPVIYLSFKSYILAMRLSPEILAHIQVLGELLGFFSTLLLVGGLTIAFAWRKIDEEKR